MNPSPFRYFADPYNFSNFTPEDVVCDLCQATRRCFLGQFHRDQHITTVCEICLVEGLLAQAGGGTGNEANRGMLQSQLAAQQPARPQSDLARLIQEKSDLIERCTPCIETWQGLSWPAHCGEYCRFIKEAGQADFNALAPDGDGEHFFKTHLLDGFPGDVWPDIRPDSPTSNANAFVIGVYLFQCLTCNDLIILWDAN